MFQYHLWEFKWKISTKFEQVYLVFPRGWTYRITVFYFYLHTIILTISLFWLLWGTREKLNKICILIAWNAFSENAEATWRFTKIIIVPQKKYFDCMKRFFRNHKAIWNYLCSSRTKRLTLNPASGRSCHNPRKSYFTLATAYSARTYFHSNFQVVTCNVT